MSSVRFPEGFVALKYPGYFWNPEEKQLYSIKVNGILTRMKANPGIWPIWARDIGPHYQISDKGRRRYIPIWNIDKFLVQGEYTIPQGEYASKETTDV